MGLDSPAWYFSRLTDGAFEKIMPLLFRIRPSPLHCDFNSQVNSSSFSSSSSFIAKKKKRIWVMLFVNLGCMDSNEGGVGTILEALGVFTSSFEFQVSDSKNVISLGISSNLPPAVPILFQVLSYMISVEFRYDSQLTAFLIRWPRQEWTDLFHLLLLSLQSMV